MRLGARRALDQVAGGIVNEVNVHREEIKQQTIAAIEATLRESVRRQDRNFLEAMAEVEKIREFLGSPENILGNPLTKHGEIAEQVEVGIGNARELIKGLPKRYSFDGVGRTAATDYLRDGVAMQSKFHNGMNNSLKAVIDHLAKYEGEGFGRNGSKYIIPKDYHETISRIILGEKVEGLSERTVEAIREKVRAIEVTTGHEFGEVVEGSISEYRDVQQGAIVRAVDGHEQRLTEENAEEMQGFKRRADDEKRVAVQKAEPSFGEALKVAGTAAAIEGSLQTAVLMLRKKKSLREYTTDDWKEVGLAFGAGAGKGAVRGAALYGLTNYASMPAPLAASLVSASFGVGSLYASYCRGEISVDDFVEQGEILCFDTALNLLGSTMGQALIPIPILGAVIGSIAASIVGGIVKDHLNASDKKLVAASRERYARNVRLLDDQLRQGIEALVAQMTELWGLSKMAFDPASNTILRFGASQRLAVAHGAPQDKILRSSQDTRDYFEK